MNQFYKILSFFCIAFVLALAGYSYFIVQKLKTQEVLFNELEAKNNRSETIIDSNAEIISENRLLLQKLDAYYSSKKTLDDDPLYDPIQ